MEVIFDAGILRAHDSKKQAVGTWNGRSKLRSLTPAQHINFGHSHFPQKISPNHQNGVPKMNFPEFPGSWFFCGNSPQTLNFSEFPGISRPPRFQHFGVPIFSVLGGNEVDMLGTAERSLFESQYID